MKTKAIRPTRIQRRRLSHVQRYVGWMYYLAGTLSVLDKIKRSSAADTACATAAINSLRRRLKHNYHRSKGK